MKRLAIGGLLTGCVVLTAYSNSSLPTPTRTLTVIKTVTAIHFTHEHRRSRALAAGVHPRGDSGEGAARGGRLAGRRRQSRPAEPTAERCRWVADCQWSGDELWGLEYLFLAPQTFRAAQEARIIY